MNAWAFAASRHSSKSPTSSTLELTGLLLVFVLGVISCGCVPATHHSQPPATATKSPIASATAVNAGYERTAIIAGNSAASREATTNKAVVLFDSYHANNFLDRGLVPYEHNYHRITGLRRARQLLTDRDVEVRELIIGPINDATLSDVNLVVLNLPSMERPPWLVPEIEAVERFIRRGGGMIFITDHSNCYYHQFHLLPLWQRLGLIPTFETTCERQADCMLTKTGAGWLLVRKFEQHPVTEGVHYFAMQTGGRVAGEGTLAWTSPQAWADTGSSPLYGEGNVGLFGDMQLTDSEEQGAQGVVLARNIDRGRVVIIADQNAIGDAVISYADNWRLWLNACRWAGQLPIDTGPLRVSRLRSQPPATEDTRPNFDQLIAGEPDRNAMPRMPEGAWQVQCWEALAPGRFVWGGNDPEQLVAFWCWLNRWCWTSAHQELSHPAPIGREMLWTTDAELSDLKLRLRIEQVLNAGGKVVILPKFDCARAETSETAGPTATTSTAEEPSAWCRRCLAECLTADQRESCRMDDAWHDQPIGHWFFQPITDNRASTLVLIPEATKLRNSQFPMPEVAPGIALGKWQRQFYHWLFEQP